MSRAAARRYKPLSRMEESDLYARLSGPEVLEHHAREGLLATLKRCPGLSLPELAEAARLAETTTEWHLKTLVREKYVATERQGRTRRYFPSDCPPPMRRLLLLLADPGRAAFAGLVAREPGITQKGAGERLGLAHATVYHHARLLREGGIIEARREGRSVRYSVRPERSADVVTALALVRAA